MGQNGGVYPDNEILIEVGRIAIAAGRLDAALGTLWWHLAPEQVSELDARKRDHPAELASTHDSDAHGSLREARIGALTNALGLRRAERNDTTRGDRRCLPHTIGTSAWHAHSFAPRSLIPTRSWVSGDPLLVRGDKDVAEVWSVYEKDDRADQLTIWVPYALSGA